MSILEVQHVKKSFGSRILLSDVNFSVESGEILAIIGLSGCGKSTLAKIIARLTDFDGGKVILCGKDISNAVGNEFYREMQMIFQNPEESFDPRRTLGASIAEPIKNFGVKASVSELLTRVGLPNEYFNRFPREISGGECQRAAIARAISINPKLLICDEATSALDVTIQAKIVALIKNLCVERRISCIFITHDLKIAKKIANRVLVLENGELKTFSASNFGRKLSETSV